MEHVSVHELDPALLPADTVVGRWRAWADRGVHSAAYRAPESWCLEFNDQAGRTVAAARRYVGRSREVASVQASAPGGRLPPQGVRR